MALFDVTRTVVRTITAEITTQVEADSFGAAEAAAGSAPAELPADASTVETSEISSIAKVSSAPASNTIFPPAYVAPTEEGYSPIRRERVQVAGEDVIGL